MSTYCLFKLACINFGKSFNRIHKGLIKCFTSCIYVSLSRLYILGISFSVINAIRTNRSYYFYNLIIRFGRKNRKPLKSTIPLKFVSTVPYLFSTPRTINSPNTIDKAKNVYSMHVQNAW